MDTTPPPTPAPVVPPAAPTRPTRKSKRARADAEDLKWLMGGGDAPTDGGSAKLTCATPATSVATLTVAPRAPPKPAAAVRAAVDPLTKYTPIAILRMDSDDPWMDRMVPTTDEA